MAICLPSYLSVHLASISETSIIYASIVSLSSCLLCPYIFTTYQTPTYFLHFLQVSQESSDLLYLSTHLILLLFIPCISMFFFSLPFFKFPCSFWGYFLYLENSVEFPLFCDYAAEKCGRLSQNSFTESSSWNSISYGILSSQTVPFSSLKILCHCLLGFHCLCRGISCWPSSCFVGAVFLFGCFVFFALYLVFYNVSKRDFLFSLFCSEFMMLLVSVVQALSSFAVCFCLSNSTEPNIFYLDFWKKHSVDLLVFFKK